jgi:resuscitation-promoting factor RpfB
MRRAIIVLLAAGGLLALSACGSNVIAPPASTPTATATGSVTSAPSMAPSTAPVAPSTAPKAAPTIEKGTVTKTRAIPFATTKVNDSTLAAGTTKIRSPGVVGVKTFTYEVTFTNGVETAKRLISEEITETPVTRVIAIGTKTTPQCDPNYSGACVPIASDVDCAGGSGNGPAYVQGPVRVVGTDIYGLDADGDGIGCEN